jgi:TRAP transporter TAXI family solute receptor
MKKRLLFLLVLTGLFALIIAGCSGGEDKSTEGTEGEGETEETTDEGEATGEVQLPDQLVLTTYDVGSSGHTQLTAISDAIAKEYGTQIRMIPSASGIGRLTPLKDGTAQIGGRLGDEVYFASEGIEEFASQQWGPQKLSYIYPILNDFGFLVLEDSKFETIADLKGAKIPHIIGNPSINVKVEAMLAAAGLTLDDVEIVEVTSYANQPTAMSQGQIDVSVIVPTAASAIEAEELYDVRWVDMSIFKDEDAMAKLHEIYPFGVAHDWDIGADLTKGEPETFLGYTTYAPAVYRDTDPDLVYNWLKAMDETYDVYSQASAGMTVWKAENSVPEPLGVPIHEGAVKFFKEKGMWKEEYTQKNAELIERQEKLQEAWETVTAEASEKGLSEKEFKEYWLERKAELVD